MIDYKITAGTWDTICNVQVNAFLIENGLDRLEETRFVTDGTLTSTVWILRANGSMSADYRPIKRTA